MYKLNKYYNKLYDGSNIILDLPIGGYPKAYIDEINKLQSLTSPDGIYGCEPSIVKRLNFNGEDFVLLNKLYPHAKYDVCIVAKNINKASLSDFDYMTAKQLLCTMHEFIKFVSTDKIIDKYKLENGNFNMSFNYDPHTRDRETGMHEKRFHMHLNYVTENEKNRKSPTKMSDLSDMSTKQRLIDPINELASTICYDLISNVSFGEVLPIDIKYDVDNGLPPGYKIKVDSWNIFTEEEVILELLNILEKFIKFYYKIDNAFTGSTQINETPWVRKKLLDKRKIISNIHKFDNLSNESVMMLSELVCDLEDLSEKRMDFYKQNKSSRVRYLAANGCYFTFGIYSKDINTKSNRLLSHKNIYIVIQPKMFADIGGTGNTYFDNNSCVLLHKGALTFSANDINQRDSFQQEFAQSLSGTENN